MSLSWQVRDGITLMVEDLVDAVEVPGMCVAKAPGSYATQDFLDSARWPRLGSRRVAAGG